MKNKILRFMTPLVCIVAGTQNINVSASEELTFWAKQYFTVLSGYYNGKQYFKLAVNKNINMNDPLLTSLMLLTNKLYNLTSDRYGRVRNIDGKDVASEIAVIYLKTKMGEDNFGKISYEWRKNGIYEKKLLEMSECLNKYLFQEIFKLKPKRNNWIVNIIEQ